MKKFVLWCIALCIVFGSIHLSRNTVSARTVLSDPILIPEPEHPIRIKLPNAEEYVDTSSLVPFRPGTEIDPQNQSSFKVLCPDLETIRNVPSGSTFEGCPEVTVSSAPAFVVNVVYVLASWWPPRTPDNTRPLPETKKTMEQLKSHITEKDPVFQMLSGDLLFETREYRMAGIYYDNAFELFQETDKRALAQYKLSRALWLRGRKTDAIEQASEALKLYKKGDSTWEFQEEERYYRTEVETSSFDPEEEALARHQLALVLWGLGNLDESMQEADRALNLYQQKVEGPRLDSDERKLLMRSIQELLATLE